MSIDFFVNNSCNFVNYMAKKLIKFVTLAAINLKKTNDFYMQSNSRRIVVHIEQRQSKIRKNHLHVHCALVSVKLNTMKYQFSACRTVFKC